MKYSIFPAMFFLAFLSIAITGYQLHAQEPQHKIHWGIAAPVAAKLKLLPGQGTSYSGWGNAGVCVIGEIEGTEEQALSLLIKMGITLDVTQYQVPAYGWFVMNRANLFFNPEILFPTRYKRLKVTAGIGVEGSFYFMGQLDNSAGAGDALANEIMQQSIRRISPFVSAGIQYDLKRGICLQLFLRQVLMDHFEKDTEVYFSATSKVPDLILSGKPTYLGLSFAYFF